MSESVAEAAEAAPAQPPRTQKIGRVVSDKMEKTVVVAVDSVRRHPLYHKRITRTSKFLAHDEQNACKPGYRADRGNQAAFKAEALDCSRDCRAGRADLGRRAAGRGQEQYDDPTGIATARRGQQRCKGAAVHPRARWFRPQIRRRRRHDYRDGETSAAECGGQER